MVKIKVDEGACVGCGSCVEDCPNDVYELDSEHGKTVVVNEKDCMACLSCHEICPSQALEHDDIPVAKRLYIDRKVNQIINKIL
ncbi:MULTISPECIES: ferredoxin family protein [Methanobacterium]|jgi:NAD-dependent dihydropyrimidine dehydrogenase PreA subunit|uniref:4Fe-4S binding protein n=1 Tax=Methanobacterium veterum TaxID=408577 RepID=A0A9E5DNJ5_9EURY|nr:MULTISPECIES: 4Fe-4S binding protein [Methanobacterium]MCZ3364773.1 4Fe-4S binding protein [Methanobacterium veterum]MCZ3372527.1 4Fe-4S binding protein [Methanobacterium veterum]